MATEDLFLALVKANLQESLRIVNRISQNIPVCSSFDLMVSTLFEDRVLIENWRRDYNTIRPHSALGYRPPAAETITLAYGLASLSRSVVQ
jgi:hypothetical protein